MFVYLRAPAGPSGGARSRRRRPPSPAEPGR